jgi:hypothetical protein
LFANSLVATTYLQLKKQNDIFCVLFEREEDLLQLLANSKCIGAIVDCSVWRVVIFFVLLNQI